MRGWWWVWVAACGGDDPETDVDADADADTDADSDTDTDTDADTDETGQVDDVVFSDLTTALHPFMGSLVVVSWSQDSAATVHLEYQVDPGVWLRSPDRPLAPGAHEEWIVGVPFDTDVTWRLVGDDTATADQVVRTGATPIDLPPPTLHVDQPDASDLANAPYIFTSMTSPNQNEPWWVLIYDRSARPVWALRGPRRTTMLHSRLARDGRSMYLDHDTFWTLFDRGAASTIEQTLLDGTVLHTFATPGLHHPFVELPDGSIAFGAVGLTIAESAEETIEVVKLDGTQTRLWSCQDWLGGLGVLGLCNSNTLSYDVSTDALLFSFWSLETIIEVDATTGDTRRWFGKVPGSYAFDPPASQFWWQHGGYFTDDRTLLVSSDLTPSGFGGGEGTETVIREYTVDEATGTLHEIWNAGIGEGVYAYQMGEPLRLPNGNTWHNYGHEARLREFSPAGTVVWEVEWDTAILGRTMPLVDLYALVPERP